MGADPLDGGIDRPGGRRDEGVAVDAAVRGRDGTGQPVVRASGDVVATQLVQPRVGHHDTDRRVGDGARAGSTRAGSGALQAGVTRRRQLRPRLVVVAGAVDVAPGVGGDESGDDQVAVAPQRTDQPAGNSALDAPPLGRGRSGAGTDPTDGRTRRRTGDRLGGRDPTLLDPGTDRGVADGQVEQAETDHDRHPARHGRQTPVVLL